MTEQQFQYNEQDTAREDVNSWVARFVPLVMGTDALDHKTTTARLELVDRLNSELQEVSLQASKLDAINDHELISTFRMAKSQINAIENDLRTRLGKISPGEPGSRADLDDLQERLAENAAKIEMGVRTDLSTEAKVEMTTSEANWLAGSGLFIFGLGWNSFTTFHAVMMIGGMSKAFGPGAFALLAFYAIFFFAGFAMWAGAFVAAAQESIVLEGDQLTVRRKLGPLDWKKTYTLDIDADATIGRTQNNNSNSNNSLPAWAVILTDARGKPINLSAQTTQARRKEIVKRINSYLQAQRAAA